MTVPVTQEIKNGNMTMQFYLPSKFNKDNAHKPSNSEIKVLTIEGGYYAVIKYSGRSSDKNFIKNKELLEKNAGNALSPRFSEENIDIILICDRKDDIGIQVNRDLIEDNIYSQKMGMMSRRHLRDLRRDAVIEYR